MARRTGACEFRGALEGAYSATPGCVLMQHRTLVHARLVHSERVFWHKVSIGMLVSAVRSAFLLLPGCGRSFQRHHAFAGAAAAAAAAVYEAGGAPVEGLRAVSGAATAAAAAAAAGACEGCGVPCEGCRAPAGPAAVAGAVAAPTQQGRGGAVERRRFAAGAAASAAAAPRAATRAASAAGGAGSAVYRTGPSVSGWYARVAYKVCVWCPLTYDAKRPLMRHPIRNHVMQAYHWSQVARWGAPLKRGCLHARARTVALRCRPSASSKLSRRGKLKHVKWSMCRGIARASHHFWRYSGRSGRQAPSSGCGRCGMIRASSLTSVLPCRLVLTSCGTGPSPRLRRGTAARTARCRGRHAARARGAILGMLAARNHRPAVSGDAWGAAGV